MLYHNVLVDPNILQLLEKLVEVLVHVVVVAHVRLHRQMKMMT